MTKDRNIASPIRGLVTDLIDLAEQCNTDAIFTRQELRLKDKLLNARKTHKTGKRIALKGQFLLTYDDILHAIKKAEKNTRKTKSKKHKKTLA